MQIQMLQSKRFFQQIGVCLSAVLMATCTFANPVLDNVAAGNVTVQQSGNTTQVNQTSQQAIINWQSFNINANEKTQFVQPNASSIALNRINPTQGASQIYGQLSANGQIILVNQAGIYFGPTARVDVSGLIASTTDITNANFLAGKYIFNQASSYHGSIINAGTIIAAQNGLIALLGNSVRNDGLIQANLGSIVLGSGSQFTLDFSGDQLINFSIDAASTAPGVDQNGQAVNYGVQNIGGLITNGGKILVSAQAAQSVLNNAINMQGIAQAQSVSQQGGDIILSGGNDGTVNVSGTLTTAAQVGSGADGGTIKILGNAIHLTAPAVLNANGEKNGGTIIVGGDAHGAGPDQNASTTTIDQGATLTANAGTQGNGGSITIWSNNDTEVHGSLAAMGGSGGGHGGWIETSGGYLNVDNIKIDLTGKNGFGTWLLDPYDVTITTSSDATETYASSTYTPTGNTSNILASELMTYLATANVTVSTSGGGSQNGDIAVNTALTWGSPTTLTLNATRNIYINAAINAPAGSLMLSASNGTQSLTGGTIGSGSIGGSVTSEAYAINVANFTLQSGQWFQAATSLPTFNVTNNFVITTGTVFNANGQSGQADTGFAAQFTRLNTTSGMNGIVDVFGLQGVATGPLSTNYQLNNNIDATVTRMWNGSASNAGFTPIGTYNAAYTGTFNGQNNVINNLYISFPSSDRVGLFGVNNGTISNVGIINATIAGYSRVGGLAGDMGNALSNSFSTGTVTSMGGTDVGGLVGIIEGSVNTSYSSVNVISEGGANAGGLIGYYNSTQTSSDVYSTGSVTGFDSVGGLIGKVGAAGTISNAYSTGAVTGISNVGGLVGNLASGTVSNSYWDTQTSGQSSSAAGTGLTTTQMLQSSNLTGFDISTSSGHTWYQMDGSTRPILQMEIANPANIVTAHGLELINMNLSGTTYALGGNIDASGTSNAADVWGSSLAGGNGFAPIGPNSGSAFTGKLNNSNTQIFTINNLYINSSATNVGLFGYTSGATIQNIGLTNVNIFSTGSGALVGSIVGDMASGTANNLYATGFVQTTNGTINTRIGGLFGEMDGALSNSYNATTVSFWGSGTWYGVGGVIGGVDTGATINNTYNIGTLNTYGTSGGTVGGIIGGITSATVNYSYNAGYINNGGSGATIGGLIGDSFGTNTLNYNYYDTTTTGSAPTQAIGNNSSTSSQAVGQTTSWLETQSNYNAGWTFTAGSGNWYIPNNSTRPILQMEAASTQDNVGNYIIQNAHQLELMNLYLTRNYVLENNLDLSGLNNAADIWATTTLNGGGGFVPIGSASSNFTGTLNGNNFTVNNFYINYTPASSPNLGLFGQISGSSVIKNLGVTNLNMIINTPNGNMIGGLVGQTNSGTTVLFNDYVTGNINILKTNGSRAGGLVGLNVGNISDSYSTVSLSMAATNYFAVMGGFAGLNTGGSSLITQSYATGNLTANVGTGTSLLFIGGFIGENQSTVTNSYSLGNINVQSQTSSVSAGGFVGVMDGKNINNSYSTGSAYTDNGTASGFAGSNGVTNGITNSYWDATTSGTSTGIGSNTGSATLTGLTTAQLQAGLPSGFSSTIWGTIAGAAYPYLLYFYPTTPRVISGSSSAVGGTTVALVVNGALINTTYTGANGAFYFLEKNGVIADSSNILAYLNSGAIKANAVSIAASNGGSVTGLALTTNTVTVGGTNTAALSTNALATAYGSLSSPNILYSVSGGALTLNSGDSLVTTSNTTYTTNGNITTSGVGSLLFNGSMVLGAATTLSTSSDLGVGAINLNGYGLTMTASGNTTQSGIISGNGALTYNGGGTTTLSQANAYTGITTIANGNVIIGNNGSLGNGNVNLSSGVLTVTNTGTTTLNGNLSGSGALTANMGSGSLVVSSADNSGYSGTVTLTSGTLQVGNNIALGTGSLNLNGGNLQASTAVSLGNVYTIGGNVMINGSQDLTLTGTGTMNNGTTLTINNAGMTTLSNTLNGAGNLVSNSQLILSGANNYTGSTTINTGGNLSIRNTSGLGNTNSVSVASGGTLDFNFNNATLANSTSPFTINGALTFSGTGMTIANDVSLGSGSTFTNASDNTFSGAITLVGSSTMTTSGTLTLNGAIDGNADLATAGQGTIVFNRRIGNLNPINRLTTNSLIVLNGINVNTLADQVYNNTVQMTGNTQLNIANGGNIQFNANVSGAFTTSSSDALTVLFGNGVNVSQLTSTATNSTLSFATNPTAIQLTLVNQTSGSVQGNGIALNYTGFNQLMGSNNANDQLQLVNKPNTINITGAGSGTINDPLSFSGFETLLGMSNQDYATFSVPYASTNTSNRVIVNGSPMYLVNIYNPATLVVTPVPSTAINSQQQVVSNTSSATTILTQSLAVSTTVNDNVTTIVNNQIQLTDDENNNKQKFKFNCQ